jgi:hypothetical protein
MPPVIRSSPNCSNGSVTLLPFPFPTPLNDAAITAHRLDTETIGLKNRGRASRDQK